MWNHCWLQYRRLHPLPVEYNDYCRIGGVADTAILQTALQELRRGITALCGSEPLEIEAGNITGGIWLDRIARLPEEWLDTHLKNQVEAEGFCIKTLETVAGNRVIVTGQTDVGVLYGVFALLRLLQTGQSLRGLERVENPFNPLRLLNHWDNPDGSVERGYAGASLFFKDNRICPEWERLRDYARLLASVGINGVVINNVNVKGEAVRLITAEHLSEVARLAECFRNYGIRIYLSVNFASPIWLDNLPTADPLASEVRQWWRTKAEEVYRFIPDLGGFLVKADSEFNPGPFTYGRTPAEGANMLAEAVEPFGGVVIWRCFVYNCRQDWRDRTIDRARAAYDHFKPLDGLFNDNVILQIKNGPVDFQPREPVSPLLGGLTRTQSMLELQITQEYTGQQKDLCFLVPQWKETLNFDTYACGAGTPVKKIVAGRVFHHRYGGMAGVANVGTDPNWTGHDLAQANLYGFGRLAWDPNLSATEIATEWVRLTFSTDPLVVATITEILLDSWPVYECYTAPLGVGWMVNPQHHYGPNVDGYEYSPWGTYHRADCWGIGVDRTMRTGTGYTGQYYPENAARYESITDCPDELLLFFHHVPYTHRLKSGLTVIQHIYNTHFDGVDQVTGFRERWLGLKGKVPNDVFERVLHKFDAQLENAREWRDVINTYFYRKSGIEDQLHRRIY